MPEKTLNVAGMHCRSCELLLSDALSEIKGARFISADFKKGLVTVETEDSLLPKIKAAIEKEGYKVGSK